MVEIKENLIKIFPFTKCMVIDETIPLLEEAFDAKRRQYQSHIILNQIQGCAVTKPSLNRVLGVADVSARLLNYNALLSYFVSLIGILVGSFLTLIMLEKKGIFPGLPFTIILGLAVGIFGTLVV